MFNIKFLSSAPTAAAGWLLHAAGGAALLLLLASGWGFHHCCLRELSSLEQQLGEAHSCRQNAEEIRRDFAATQKRLSATLLSTRDLQGHLRLTSDASTFLAKISQLAGASQIAVRRFQPSHATAAAADKRFVARDVALDCEGTYADLCRFLLDLQSSDEMCQVVSMTVGRAGDATDRCRIELQMRLYSLPSPAPQSKPI